MVDTSAFDVLTTGASAVTLTVSAVPATRNLVSSATAEPTPTVTLELWGPNPDSSTLRMYVPGWTLAMTYRPTASETVVRTAPLVVDVRVIVAPGTTKSFGSLTVPVTRPVSVCANTVDGTIVTRLANTKARRSNTFLRRITSAP